MSVSLETYHQNQIISSSKPITTTTSSPKIIQTSSSNRSNSSNDVIENNRVLISSFLYKRSTHTKHWKKKWMVLRKCQLSYYKDSREYKPLKVYNSSRLLSFNIIPDHHKNHLAIYTTNKVLHFKTDDDILFNKWIDALHEFFNLKDHINDVDADEEEEEEEYEEFEDSEELLRNTSSEQRVKDFVDDEKNSRYEGSTTSSSNIEPPNTSTTTSSSNIEPPNTSTTTTTTSTTLPVHSIQNKQSQVKRNGSYTSDSITTETSDEVYSSDGFLSDSPLTPNIAANSISNQLFHPLDVPREEDERDKSPVKSLLPITNESRETNPRETSPPEEIQEYIIEEGSLKVLKKKYNQQWKKYHVILTNKSLNLKTSNGIRLSIPIYDIEDVIELDPINSKKKWCLMIITPLKRLRFSCNDENDMTKWFSAFKAASQTNKRI